MRAVDHFPRCNDPFGPGAGDPLLNRMAQLLRSRTRAGSMASRYGGEEFTLVLPQATLASTRVRAARLRSAVTQLQGPYASRVRDPITRSRDVARFPPHGASAQTLRQAASSALDAAKPGGQDGVAVAPAI